LVSSAGSDFNYDFGVSFTDEQLLQGATYNFRTMPPIPADELDQWPRDLPGTSAFVLDGDEVFHTYSSYARGGDALWSMYQWLDRAPGGRNEAPGWFRLHDGPHGCDRAGTRGMPGTLEVICWAGVGGEFSPKGLNNLGDMLHSRQED